MVREYLHAVLKLHHLLSSQSFVAATFSSLLSATSTLIYTIFESRRHCDNMALLKGGFQRLLQTFLYFLCFLCSGIILGVYSYVCLGVQCKRHHARD